MYDERERRFERVEWGRKSSEAEWVVRRKGEYDEEVEERREAVAAAERGGRGGPAIGI